jgi:hypothetical protein
MRGAIVKIKQQIYANQKEALFTFFRPIIEYKYDPTDDA